MKGKNNVQKFAVFPVFSFLLDLSTRSHLRSGIYLAAMLFKLIV